MVEAKTYLREEKFYSKLDPILDVINRTTVRINEEERKYCVGTTMNVVEKLIEELKKEDPVFKSFYNRLMFVGSYYDGLRVSAATEFDINLILSLPCDKIEVENSNVSCGFVRLKVINAIDQKKLNTPGVSKALQRMINDDGYILHNKVLSWWESVLSKISVRGKHLVECEGKSYEVTFSKSGPAQTLHIQSGKFVIDVDLVPAIEFNSSCQPPSPIRWIPAMADSWVVVPKPVIADNTFWRLSFPKQEQNLMNGLLHLKYINRLLKKFRDANNLNIPSYYIKTLFLWEVFEQNQNNNKEFWRKPPSFLFPYMLVKLADALEKKFLRFFWHKKMNLFQTLPPDNLKNMEGCVKRILVEMNKLLEKGDDVSLKKFIYKLFGLSELDILRVNTNELSLQNDPSDNNASSDNSWCSIS